MALTFAGGTATDVLASVNPLQFAQLTSYFVRFNLIALDATKRQLLKWTDGTTTTLTSIVVNSTVLEILVQNGVWTTSGDWTIAVPSTGAEHSLLITYDAGLTTNNPVAYLDGSSVTVTTVAAPTGSPVFTNSLQVLLGNNKSSSGTNCLNYWQDIFAIWKGVLLGQPEATMLNAGKAPCHITPLPALYVPCDQGESPETETIAGNNFTVTGTTVVTGSTKCTNPRCLPVFPTEGRMVGRVYV
jgi:hypothetical protein